MLENCKMVGHWYEDGGWAQWFKWIRLAALLNQIQTKKSFLNKRHQNRFSFISSETPLSPAAAVVNIVSDEFHHRLVCHLIEDGSSFLVTVCITLRLPITCLGNLTLMQHSKLQLRLIELVLQPD